MVLRAASRPWVGAWSRQDVTTRSTGDRTFILGEAGRLRKESWNYIEVKCIYLSSAPKWKASAARVAEQGLFVCAHFRNTKLIYSFRKEGNPSFLPNLWNSLRVNRGWQIELLQGGESLGQPLRPGALLPAAPPGCRSWLLFIHWQHLGLLRTKPFYSKISYQTQ